MNARDAILQRIRSAVAGSPEAPEPPRDYRRHGDADARLARFTEVVTDYRATLRRVAEGGVAAAAAELCAARGARRLLAPPGLPDAWLPDGPELIRDPALSPGELDAIDGVMTGCAVAVADTGTLILDGGPGQGRRADTLVPDWHLCVVRADQLVASVPEAVAALEGAVRAGRPLTLVSGPSATSDIELSRVEGVHGPRTLDILFVPAP